MSLPRHELLSAREWHAALHALGDIAESADDAASFATTSSQALSRMVASDLTTLSRCDLRNGRRAVFGVPAGAIGADERAAFDRHFRSHPLVRYHAIERGRYAHRITDSLSMARFRQTPLFNDYYRRIGLDHALALPVWHDDGELVSIVFNRQGHDFSDRELAQLDVLRQPLARLFGRVRDAESPSGRWGLTPRETDVLRWVVAGKTDRDIALIVGCGVRTVHKHLQRVYTKLGVETRTAAAMRWLRHS